MAAKSLHTDAVGYSTFDDGIRWMQENRECFNPKEGERAALLDAHDLDTIAMGIALVVLHAADIQTIAATMDTQQKLGVAEKVLGWLHLFCDTKTVNGDGVTLHETDPNPWLDLGMDGAAVETWNDEPAPSPNHLRQVSDPRMDDDEIPF